VIALDSAGAVKGVRLHVVREPNGIKRQLTGDQAFSASSPVSTRATRSRWGPRHPRQFLGADQSSETIAFSVKKMLVHPRIAGPLMGGLAFKNLRRPQAALRPHRVEPGRGDRGAVSAMLAFNRGYQQPSRVSWTAWGRSSWWCRSAARTRRPHRSS